MAHWTWMTFLIPQALHLESDWEAWQIMGAKEDGVVTPSVFWLICLISEENKSYLRLTLGLFCLFQNLATSAGKVHGIVLGIRLARGRVHGRVRAGYFEAQEKYME